MPRTALALALAGLACAGGAAQAASNCDEIKAQIDAKVRAAGVSQFTLSVVDADDPAAGKVVGRCDRGSKKIVYLAGSAAAFAGAHPHRMQGRQRQPGRRLPQAAALSAAPGA